MSQTQLNNESNEQDEQKMDGWMGLYLCHRREISQLTVAKCKKQVQINDMQSYRLTVFDSVFYC